MKKKIAFGARMQIIVIVSMIVSFGLIIQKMNMALYKIGLVLLIVSALSQMAFGNMPSEADFKEGKKIMMIAYTIVACVFGLGILLAPILIKIGR
ncbi:MAG: hypothetical protein WCB15_33835 [Desulfobacterales bacterium]|jgi:hypothetical protein